MVIYLPAKGDFCAPVLKFLPLCLLLCYGFCGSVSLLAQSPKAQRTIKTLEALRIETPWKIDGELDAAVRALPPAEGFRQNTPRPGEAASQATQVWFGFDDEAVYVVARLFDTHPDSILQQLSERDRLRNTDYFGVVINPYRDGINATTFVVTPANVQYDSKFSSSDDGGGNQPLQSGDPSWDGVWASATSIDSLGWTAELRIPYSMLRFTDEEVQTWDINFGRQIRRRREESFWNFIDPKGPALATQLGKASGLVGLRPPVRFQATPFVTVAGTHRSTPEGMPRNDFGSSLGGGLDLKYGLSDAFTLDMTLIPDFSNARSDDQVLNLSANEIRFDENRAFFTEGTELFQKGGFFYSRRIGGSPINASAAFDAAAEGEEVISNPARAQLLNATKVSGRLANGLGIGVFNAVEAASEAVLRTSATGETRRVQTSPLTNYSVVSFDQNLPNNSFATLINTTVLRSGSTYDANLTGLVWDLRDKPNDWSVNGSLGVSQQYGLQRGTPTPENVFGHKLNFDVDRLTGRLRYGVGYGEESPRYDPNDLGLLFFNNSREANVYGEYNWFEPFGKFNSASVSAFTEVAYLNTPSVFNYAGAGSRFRMTTREFFTFGGGVFSELRDGREFQDTRTPGVGLVMLQYGEVNAFISSDYRKTFAVDVRTEFGRFWRDGATNSFNVYVSPRARLGDKLALRLEAGYNKAHRFLGYIGHSAASAKTYQLAGLETGVRVLGSGAVGYDGIRADGIVMSYRDVEIMENQATIEYSFTANVNVNLRIRHYWSRVFHREYFEIQGAGTPIETTYTGRNPDGSSIDDRSFNAVNVDGFFRWRFAPGSDVFVSYKTQSYFAGILERGYLRNLGVFGQESVDNSLTLKVVYWLDYNEVKGRLRGREG